MLGKYAIAARGIGAHLRLCNPWAYGGYELITQEHRADVTAGFPQSAFTSFPQVSILSTSTGNEDE